MTEIVICGMAWDTAEDAAFDLGTTPTMITRFMRGGAGEAASLRIARIADEAFRGVTFATRAEPRYCDCGNRPWRGTCQKPECQTTTVSLYDIPKMTYAEWKAKQGASA